MFAADNARLYYQLFNDRLDEAEWPTIPATGRSTDCASAIGSRFRGSLIAGSALDFDVSEMKKLRLGE